MASCTCPDIWAWIQNLAPITQWQTNSMSICICSSKPTRSSISLTITRNLQNHSPSISCSIVANLKLSVSLWTSKPVKIKAKTANLSDEETLSPLFCNFITDVLHYGPNNGNSFLYIPPLQTISNFKDMFNLSFFTLTVLVCIYESPQDTRLDCMNTLRNHLTDSQSREASKTLMRLLGSNIEEQWMRSLNLAITNWIVENKASDRNLRTPSPLFSYSTSTVGLWKVQLYCPVIAMHKETSSSSSPPERLGFSLLYHQLEGVIQFGHKFVVRDKWIDVGIQVDNIRCDVIRLVSESLMTQRGMGTAEKHFPSRISLQLTPTIQTNVLSVSVSKSSENPVREIESERTLEAGFDVPGSILGLKVSAKETTRVSLKPWKFEQSVYGDSANLNWFLHDSSDGREVSTSKPSKLELLQPKAWFKDRYSSVYRPFTKQGGVIFAGDQYGETTWWRVDRNMSMKTMEWEIKGCIWLTYWPNKHLTLYNETPHLGRELEILDQMNSINQSGPSIRSDGPDLCAGTLPPPFMWESS